MIDKLNKKNISVVSFLAKFFAFITVGGVFLSFGIVGVYRLVSNLPITISPLFIIASLIFGLFLDGLGILYFLKHRESFFNQLFKEDE